MSDAPPRLTVGVVGVGRAGSVLGAALQRAGHPVARVHAVSETARLRAEARLPEAQLTEVEEIFRTSDLVLVTVPDDELPGLISGVAKQGWIKPGQFVVHSSGRYGCQVLQPATAAGALPLALHPAMTLTGSSIDLDRLTDCPFGVTAPEPLLPVAQALVVEMGGEPITISEEARPLYHAALAYSANHATTLVSDAVQLLADSGIEQGDRLVGPLLRASIDNALAQGDQALTGPVARADAGTIADHLSGLEAVSQSVAEVYRVLARRTADRALAAGTISAQQAEKLLGVLSNRGDS